MLSSAFFFSKNGGQLMMVDNSYFSNNIVICNKIYVLNSDSFRVSESVYETGCGLITNQNKTPRGATKTVACLLEMCSLCAMADNY